MVKRTNKIAIRDLVLNLRLIGALVVSMALGCHNGSSASANPNDTNIKFLSALFARHQIAFSGRAPADREQFVEYMRKRESKLLEKVGVSDPNELFISKRDGKPYVMFFGKEARNPRLMGITGYEKEGVGGKRFVGFQSGDVQLWTEEEFTEMLGIRP